MSPTIDDLRRTLDAHSRDLDAHGDDVTARLSGVRHRVAAARRRRAAAGVTAAAVVLAGVVGLTTLRSPAPDDSTLPVAGQDVATSTTMPGGEYAYATSVSVDDMTSSGGGLLDRTAEVVRAETDLPRASADRAVALVATGLDGGTVTVTTGDRPGLLRLVADGVSPVASIGDVRTTLRLVLRDVPADAQVSVVVYDRTDARVPGTYSADGTAWFRDEAEGRTLEAATFSPASGEAVATITYTGSLSGSTIAEYCRSDVPHAWVRVEVDGGYAIGGDCTDEAGDAFAGGVSYPDRRADVEHTVTIRVTEGRRGDVLGADEAVVGVAAYRDAPGAVRVGDDVATGSIEVDGREWTLERVLPVRGGAAARTAVVDLADATSARFVSVLLPDGRSRFRAVGSVSGRVASGHARTGDWGYQSTGASTSMLLPGETWRVSLTHEVTAPGAGGGTGGAILVYAPVD
ncbi:hypothetical protein [Nocardioides sp. GY 10127]|uniref:hypothetical protein n=1 Tax=Nocardioides sp. GY 10127 TaxID=2569762 RepID=UPI0010A87532|nr:hypothetical protein [Nocardioides sp. GY 10127]TIC82882.1 hypothetical protein E8D37_09495 [Nocardioides sp. GY 10127]